MFRLLARRRLRPFFITGIVLLTMVQIVALSPSPVEEAPENIRAEVDPEVFVPQNPKSLVPGIPQGKVPDYSVDQFNYVSTQDGVKQWKLVAEQAYLYNAEKLIHAKNVKAYLYDVDGKITLVTGLEAKYFMNARDLEIFGNVNTTFPDGFLLQSPYLRHRPNARKIEIPPEYPVHGDGSQTASQKMEFDSYGMDFEMAKSKIVLDRAVRVRTVAPTGEKTLIESDHCVILRDKQLAFFTMFPSRPLSSRFVRITQPSLFAQGRRTELSYGDFSKMVNYMVAYEDVTIRELDPKQSQQQAWRKYATGGRASFDTQRNVIILTEYPQVYQDNDTVTGDVIVLHRDKDIVEVEHSNAYSHGQQQR